MATIPTSYSTGKDAYLYIESVGTLRAQVNGVYALCVIFTILCWVVVSARVWVRTTMMKGMAQDDWWLLGTQVIFTVYTILLCVVCTNLLEHVTEYARGEVPVSPVVPNMIIAGYCLYALVTITFRFSLGLFFLKIFSAQRNWRITIWVTLVIPTLLGLLNIGWTAKLQCQLTSVFFAGLPSCPGFEPRTDWAIVAALWAGVSAITDLLYGVMAFLAIKKLQMPWKTRVTAVLLCSLGCVGGVAACVRLAFLIASVPNMSVLGEAMQVSIWSVIEPGLAIVAASFAALRPLWMRMKDPNWRPSDYHGSTRRTPMPTWSGGQRTTTRNANGTTEGTRTDGIVYQVQLSQFDGPRDGSEENIVMHSVHPEKGFESSREMV